MNDDLFLQGLELMLVGMGTVFVFLTLLVGATTLMSRLVGRFLTETTPAAADPGPTPEEVAAIAAAIARYRTDRG